MRLSNRVPFRGRLVTVSAALAALAGVASMAPASASARSGHVAQDTAGIISTIAGGVGGPGQATRLSVTANGVATSDGRLYIADGVVQEVGAHGILTTPAGDFGQGYAGVTSGTPATAASLIANDVAVAPNGDLVIADSEANEVVVAATRSGRYCGVAMTAGDIYVVAGTGAAGFSGNGTRGTSTYLNNPDGVAVDSAGNVLIADTYNNRVRVLANQAGTFYGKPMKAGYVYGLAGESRAGFRGDGGPASLSQLRYPTSVAVDGAGNVVIADDGNTRVRVVAGATGTFYGQSMTAGDIYTIAGNGTSTSQPGGPGTESGLGNPTGVAVDSAGNVVIADNGLSEVDVVAASTGSFYGQSMTAGYLYVLPIGPVQLRGGGTVPGTDFQPTAVTVDSAGNVVIADHTYVAVFAVQTGTFYGQPMTAGGTYAVAGNGDYAFSGDNGPATKAQFSGPEDVAVDAAGNVLVADTGNDRVRVVAATTGTFYGRPMTAGDVYNLAGNGSTAFNGNGRPATTAGLDYPYGLAVDQAGNVLIADNGQNRIQLVAASTGTFYGQSMKAGHIYTVAGGGDRGFGSRATDAALVEPNGVAVDSSGNLVIADTGDCVVAVVPATSGTFYGIKMTAGHMYKVAGDYACVYQGDDVRATKTALNYPYGVAFDAAGNILIADTDNDRVRVVAASDGSFYGYAMKAGYIYTLAGPDLGSGVLAPTKVVVDGSGNVVIADAGDSLVKVLAAASGTFYGVPMTAGGLYTVAGGGSDGLGDGGPATSAEVYHPQGVAIDGPNLVIADTDDGRVRMVTG
jgi:hypothetical protein